MQVGTRRKAIKIGDTHRGNVVGWCIANIIGVRLTRRYSICKLGFRISSDARLMRPMRVKPCKAKQPPYNHDA